MPDRGIMQAMPVSFPALTIRPDPLLPSTGPTFRIDIWHRLGDRRIACKVDAGPGITVLSGPSGVGKTTVLNMVAGLLRPDGGHIYVRDVPLFDSALGIDVVPEQRHLGYIFQDARLFPHLRVRGNLLYGVCDRADTVNALEEMASFLGVASLLDRWPSTLSVGEAQRVAIGRALLTRPSCLLMDEPLASIDRARRADILRLVERLRDEVGVPILYVTHDPSEAERLSTRIIEMDFE
jgi:molybdate transport system ATP-binding protein